MYQGLKVVFLKFDLNGLCCKSALSSVIFSVCKSANEKERQYFMRSQHSSFLCHSFSVLRGL